MANVSSRSFSAAGDDRLDTRAYERLETTNISSRQIGDHTVRLVASHLEVVAIWRLGDRIFSTLQIAEWRYFFPLSSNFVRDASTYTYYRISSAYNNIKVMLLLQMLLAALNITEIS